MGQGPARNTGSSTLLHGWCCWASSLGTAGNLLAMQHRRPTQAHGAKISILISPPRIRVFVKV